MAGKIPKIAFKIGDDFSLTLTITNKSSVVAIDAANTVINAQLLYDTELAKPTPDPGILNTLQTALVAAQTAYNLAIIVDITTWEISSSMRWVGKHITDFTVTKTNASLGILTLQSSSLETQTWKPRIYDVDIQFSINEVKSSSQTFQIDVKSDITTGDIV